MRVCGLILCSIYVAFHLGRVPVPFGTRYPFHLGWVRFHLGRVYFGTGIIWVTLWKLSYAVIKLLIVKPILVGIFVSWHLVGLFRDQSVTDQFVKAVDYGSTP